MNTQPMNILLQWPENNGETTALGCSCGVLQTTHVGKIWHLCGHRSVLAMYHMETWCIIPAAAYWLRKAKWKV